jgi:hypothetical protein
MYVQLNKDKPCVGSKRDLNLAVVRPSTAQVTNCRFGTVKYVRHNLLQKSALTDVLCISSINVIIVVKWQSVYGVHKVNMLLPGRFLSASTLVRNYHATNLAPTQKYQPLLSPKRRPQFQTHKGSWNEHKFGHGYRKGPKPKRLCWRGPAAIYWTGQWPVVIRLFLSPKRKPHFETREVLERKNIWSWVPTGHETKIDCAGEDQ